LDDNPKFNGGGDGGGFDGEPTAVTDFSSLQTSRLARAICENAILAGQVGNAIAELGLDNRWVRQTSSRVMRLIAIEGHCGEAIAAFRNILEAMEDIQRMVHNEAAVLHEEGNDT
jgi:hypothetical protein